MKKLILAVALSLSSAALAQTAPTQTFDFNDAPGSTTEASVQQGVFVNIPVRFGLQLHENQWNVDLSLENPNPSVSPGQTICYRAGSHVSTGGDDFGYDQYYTPANDAQGTTTGNIASTNPLEFLAVVNDVNTVWSGDGVVDPTNPYSYAGGLAWSSPSDIVESPGYPGFDVVSGTVWKGPLVCVNRKVLEVFSNNSEANGGMEISATISGVTPNFPRTFIGAEVQGTNTVNNITVDPAGFFGPPTTYTTTNNFEVELARRSGLSGGWRDLNILEGILLDGTEVGSATPYTAVITYTLSSIDMAPIIVNP